MRRLSLENTTLHRDIDLHRAVADDVILRDVQHRADVRVKLADALALIAAHLSDSHIVLFGDTRRRGDGIADVADNMRCAPRRAEQLANQRRRGRFAVRSRDSDQRAAAHPCTQLQLAHDLNALSDRVLHKRLRPCNARADDHNILTCSQAVRRLTQRKGACRYAQFIQLAAKLTLRLCIGNRHQRTLAQEQLCRCDAAARHAADQYALSFHVHTHGFSPPSFLSKPADFTARPAA